jgi:hypothetical protein
MIKYKKLSEMKKWEAAAYPIVKKIVDKYDPEFLLKMDCPADEYDPISRSITQAINREKFGSDSHITSDWCANIIALSFHISFGAWGQKIIYYKLYTQVASDLIKALRKKKLLKK